MGAIPAVSEPVLPGGQALGRAKTASTSITRGVPRLENPDRWTKRGWPPDRATFIKRLDELRVVRNNVMHFNPEPVPADAVEKLRYILKLLRDFGGLIAP